MASASTARHPKGPPKPEPARGAAPFLSALLDSSVGAKILVALTGLGLVSFVVFHMIGNLKVFQGPDAINAYAYFLKHSLGALIWIARAGLLAIFVLHLALAIRLTLRSRAARPIPYQFPGSVQATAASRTMIWTGVVVGLFILYHLAHFTFGWLHGVNLSTLDDKGRADGYAMVIAGFRNRVSAGLCVLINRGCSSTCCTASERVPDAGAEEPAIQRDLVAGYRDRDDPRGQPRDVSA